MADTSTPYDGPLACDAMCGGLSRWLRMMGVDCSFSPNIDDVELLRQAQAEGRLVISSDNKLFERNLFRRGTLRGLRLPVGLPLREQVQFVAARLKLHPEFPRCTLCNGELAPAGREDVADVVPARSLIWAHRFYRCSACGHVYWEGSHWRRINAVLGELPRDCRP